MTCHVIENFMHLLQKSDYMIVIYFHQVPIRKSTTGQEWWLMFVIPTLGKLRQGDYHEPELYGKTLSQK